METMALAFHDPTPLNYEKIKQLAKGIEAAIKEYSTIQQGLILIFDTDIGNSVGNIIARETNLNNILCIDEIDLSEGDFIDIGEPLKNSVIYPVIIKSLIFA